LSPEHVLHVLQPRTGGVPAYVIALTRGLIAAGLRVSVACSSGAPIASTLREHGVEVLELELTRAPHPAKDAVAVAAITRFCRARGVGLVHGHSTKAGLLVAIAGTRIGIPSVYTPNGWSFEQHVPVAMRAAYAAYERQLVRRYHSAVIAVSYSGRAAAERWRVASPEQVRVIPTGLPPLPSVSRVQARLRLGLGRNEIVAVWVGRDAPQKRPRDLIPIARRLAGHVTVVALCAGAAGTELDPALREAGVRLADPSCEPVVLYAAADIMLQTSAWEAAPLALLEAMSNRLPVVAYDVGGVGEQVQSGRTGYLVAPGDVAMLCECVLALAQRPQARAMGEAAARRLASRFSYMAMIRQFLAAYGELAGGAQRSPAAIPPSRARQLEVAPGREVVLA
jgi:glycosyltransferase involved in cell wall biosynthesis